MKKLTCIATVVMTGLLGIGIASADGRLPTAKFFNNMTEVTSGHNNQLRLEFGSQKATNNIKKVAVAVLPNGAPLDASMPTPAAGTALYANVFDYYFPGGSRYIGCFNVGLTTAGAPEGDIAITCSGSNQNEGKPATPNCAATYLSGPESGQSINNDCPAPT